MTGSGAVPGEKGFPRPGPGPGALVGTLLVALAVGLFAGGEVGAQAWTADLHAGRSSFGAPPLGAGSTNATMGVRFADGHRLFHASLAAPLAAEDLFWGVLGAGDRLAVRRGRFEGGVDVSGLGHLQRDPVTDRGGSGVRGEVMPFVSASVGTLVVEVRSGASLYRGRIGGESWARNLHVSDLSLSLPLPLPLPSGGREHLHPVRLGGELRHLQPRGDEGAYTWAGGSVSGGTGRAGMWLSLGRWVQGIASEDSSTGFGGGASFALSPRTVLWAQGRREPFDPFFLGSDRTSWGLGASYRMGAPVPPPPLRGAEIRERGKVTIRLPLSEAGSPPAVAGDFSGWDPVPMHRRGSNWEVTLQLPPGAYRYAFHSGTGEWFVPVGVPGRRDDGMGGWVATLIVPAGSP
jgi:hypothetical protein